NVQQIFQFNSHGMRSLLMEMGVDSPYDLIAANALYRPGAMGTGMHHAYARVKNGLEKPEYLPQIQHIIEETHFQMVYQEQVMQIFQTLADYSLQEADSIRRAIGKKDMKEMQ